MNLQEKIDDILELAMFQIFPSSANDNRLKAKAELITLFSELIEGAKPTEYSIKDITASHRGHWWRMQGYNQALADYHTNLTKLLRKDNL